MADDQYKDDLNLEELKGYLDEPAQGGDDASLEDILKEYHEERVLAPRQRPAGASSGLLENPYADAPAPEEPHGETPEPPQEEPDKPAGEPEEAGQPEEPEPEKTPEAPPP